MTFEMKGKESNRGYEFHEHEGDLCGWIGGLGGVNGKNGTGKKMARAKMAQVKMAQVKKRKT